MTCRFESCFRYQKFLIEREIPMGLDNGFILKKINKADIPSFIRYDDEYREENEVELIYWRKCWGLRNAVLRVLHVEDERGYYRIDAEDIPAILRNLYPFLSKEYWEDNADSIWTFEEKVESLIQDILNLKWLYAYMEDHPEVECYFYDSY